MREASLVVLKKSPLLHSQPAPVQNLTFPECTFWVLMDQHESCSNLYPKHKPSSFCWYKNGKRQNDACSAKLLLCKTSCRHFLHFRPACEIWAFEYLFACLNFSVLVQMGPPPDRYSCRCGRVYGGYENLRFTKLVWPESMRPLLPADGEKGFSKRKVIYFSALSTHLYIYIHLFF